MQFQDFYRLTNMKGDKTPLNWKNEPEVKDTGPNCPNCKGGLIRKSPIEFKICPVCQGTGLKNKLV